MLPAVQAEEILGPVIMIEQTVDGSAKYPIRREECFDRCEPTVGKLTYRCPSRVRGSHSADRTSRQFTEWLGQIFHPSPGAIEQEQATRGIGFGERRTIDVQAQVVDERPGRHARRGASEPKPGSSSQRQDRALRPTLFWMNNNHCLGDADHRADSVGHHKTDPTCRAKRHLSPIVNAVTLSDASDLSEGELGHQEVARQEDGPALTRDLALATWGLFVGLTLLMISAGLFGALIGVRSELARLTTFVSSLISAAYYVGFLFGSKFTLAALGRVGHIRVYAALASILSAAMIAAGLTTEPVAWVGLRFATGVSIAGIYVVAESWLNDLAENENRGRLLAIYNLVASAGFGGGQLLISNFDARLMSGYALAAILTSLAIAPVSLSEKSRAPIIAERIHLSMRELARVVPTGAGSCLLVGVAHGALFGMAAVYATRAGLSLQQTGIFLTAPMIGGVIFQWPISSASDDVDRRAVGVVAAIGAMIAGALLLLGPPDRPMAFVLIGLVGGASYPLYSIAGAYTNDWVEPSQVNAAASQLIVLYGIGAIVGPFVAAGLMIAAGPVGFLWSIILLHGAIAAFLIYRMFAWRSPLAKRPWDEVSLPARAFFLPATVIALTRSRSRKTQNSQNSQRNASGSDS